jgi:hypothetical protein
MCMCMCMCMCVCVCVCVCVFVCIRVSVYLCVSVCMQVEVAEVLVLNKVDLVPSQSIPHMQVPRFPFIYYVCNLFPSRFCMSLCFT